MYKPNYNSLLEFIVTSSKQWKNKEALVIRRRIRREVITYDNLLSLLPRFEAWFEEQKIGPTAKVLFWGLNCPEYTVSLLSIMSFARTAIPIDWRSNHETIQKIIKKTKPTFAFVSKHFQFDFIYNRNMKVYFIEDLLTLLEQKKLKPKSLKKLLTTKQYTKQSNLVEVVFTSGTTGQPKGVIIQQKNILANLKAIELRLPKLYNSRTISILPLSHMLEQVAGMLLPLGQGTSIFYLPTINSFKLLQAFKEYHPTHLVFVPQLLKIFWGKLEDEAKKTGRYLQFKRLLTISPYIPVGLKKLLFSKIHKLFGGSLDFIACGGAPLDKHIGESWDNVGIPIVEGYGATEVTAVATFNNALSPNLGTVGKPLSGIQITINKDGEIYIKSESITSGYFGDRQKTAAAFTPQGYRTGDIGEWDKQGNLRIIGRDVFKIVLPSGEKVFVEDLERKLNADTRIKEACVVAKTLPDGDKIHAYIILKKDMSLALKQIVADINKTLESKQQITSYKLWSYSDFPRTATLKIDRKLVQSVANGQKDLQDALKQKSDTAFVYKDIVDIVAKISGFEKSHINDSDTLALDLDLDSLSRVELVALAEEHLGIEINEKEISARTTVKDLKKITSSAQIVEAVKIANWQFTNWGQWLHYFFVAYILIPLHSYFIRIVFPQGSTYINAHKITPGSIIITNHPGILDLVCGMRLLQKFQEYQYVTFSWENNWIPRKTLTYLLELILGALPLYKSASLFSKVMRKASDLMDTGYCMFFLPQGTPQKQSQPENPFLPGMGYVIDALAKPVYVVKIKGYTDIWPNPEKGWKNCSFWELLPPKRGTVRVYLKGPLKIPKSLNYNQIANFVVEEYQSL